MRRISKALAFVILCVCVQKVYAFSGHIASETVWSTDVIVTGDVWVDAGKTLVINAGVKIKFVKINPLSHFYVNGTVLAQGTYNAPIYFTSYELSPAPADWEVFNCLEPARIVH